MEEAKAAAYYEELTRKGEGAARFKQGLGFSTSSSSRFPSKPSSSSSSLLSSFVRASSPGKAADLEKQCQLHKIHNKLNPSREEERLSRERDRHGERRRRRSRSASPEREHGGYRRGKDRDRELRRRSRSRSPRRRESRDRGYNNKREKGGGGSQRSRVVKSNVDYSQLIEGYAQMTPAERVKAKMKLQLSQTAAKDTSMGMTTGWERFDFNKDAPLDGDDEIEVAEDDASLVKVIGRSFRSSAAEAKREEEVKAAHDQAMFGAPAGSPVVPVIESHQETDETDLGEKSLGDVLISDKVIAKQQGSWRDRARRFQNSSGN